jgi:hypothetical protein
MIVFGPEGKMNKAAEQNMTLSDSLALAHQETKVERLRRELAQAEREEMLTAKSHALSPEVRMEKDRGDRLERAVKDAHMILAAALIGKHP